jgi:DNA polymerase III, epsilon subunit and related 3''-5'' exonucleases
MCLKERFRGYYPVVIDVETAGFNPKTDALLEIAATTLQMDQDGWLALDQTVHFHVEPFEGANIEKAALILMVLIHLTRYAVQSVNMMRCMRYSKLSVKE